MKTKVLSVLLALLVIITAVSTRDRSGLKFRGSSHPQHHGTRALPEKLASTPKAARTGGISSQKTFNRPAVAAARSRTSLPVGRSASFSGSARPQHRGQSLPLHADNPPARPGHSPSSGSIVALSNPKRIASPVEGYGKLPLSFEANRGQLSPDVKFHSQGAGYNLFLNNTGTDIVLSRSRGSRDPGSLPVRLAALSPGGRTAPAEHPGVPSGSFNTTKEASQSARLRMTLAGASPHPQVSGDGELPGKVNYFIGSDPSRWRVNIPTYRRVKYNSVYRGIDLLYYGNQQKLEYDFIVSPSADPHHIQMSFNGAAGAQVDKHGNLLLELPGGRVVQRAPVLYQVIHGARHSVQGMYRLLSMPSTHPSIHPPIHPSTLLVGFQVAAYDHSQPLVIDPVLVYSTYLGGTGNDRASAIAVDGAGNAYITGRTNSTDLATTAGSFEPQSTISDVFKTTNGAASFAPAGGGLPDALITSLAVDPRTPTTVYVGTGANNSFTAQGLFKSVNGGVSYVPIDNGLTDINITQVVIDPVTPTTVYVTAERLLFKSTDGGASFNVSTTGLPTDQTINALAIDPKTPTTLYAGVGIDIFKSANGGATWNKLVPPGTIVQEIVIDPTNSSTLYAAGGASAFGGTSGGVFKSTDGGATWNGTGLSGAFPFTAHALAIDPTNPSVLYESDTAIPTSSSGQVNELQRSVNGGATWTVIQTGDATRNQGQVNAIVVAPTTPSMLYAATSDQGVLKSIDGGTTLQLSTLPATSVTALALSPTDPNTLYAGTPGRLTIPGNSIVPGFPSGGGAPDDNAFVAKLSPAGDTLLYLTYLGGVGDTEGNGIAVDAAGDAYITGFTFTGTFPTTPGVFQATPKSQAGRTAAFVTKLSPTGSSLLYSTYLGGSGGAGVTGDQGHAIAIDAAGDAFITGLATSSDFPTTPNSIQTTNPSNGAVFVTKLDPNGASLLYSTFLGSGGAGEGIAVDGSGAIFVTGSTFFSFPTTAGALISSISTGPGAFLSAIDPGMPGTAGLLYSTYLHGTNGTSTGRGVAVDGLGNAYVTGNTTATDFPVRNGFQTTFGGLNPNTSDHAGDAFVTRINPLASGNASLLYSTYLGGSSEDSADAITLDASGNAVITGWTFSSDFPARSTIQPFLGFENAFVASVNTSATGDASLLYSLFLGGSNDNAEGHGIAADAAGNVYVTGFTGSQDFQTSGPIQPVNRGLNDAFVVKLGSSTASADLSVTDIGAPDPVEQGSNVTYTITVTNSGPFDAAGVTLSDTLSSEATFISATIQPVSQSNNSLRFNLGTVPSGGQVQLQVTVSIGKPSNLMTPTVTNTALVRSSVGDPNPANNTATATNTITPHVADVSLTATAFPSPVVQGTSFTYTLTAANAGPNTASGVTITEILPPGVTLLSATPAPTTQSGSTLTFMLGTIPSGGNSTVSLKVMPNVTSGSVENIASVTANENDPNTDNNTSTIDTVITTADQADLGVTLTGPTSPAAVGSLTYTATVTNNGPHIATGVTLTDAFTAGFQIVSATLPQGTSTISGSTVTSSLGSIAMGASVTVTIVISVPTDARITGDATVSGNEKDPVSFNNTAEVHTTVRAGSVRFVVVNTNDSGPGSFRQAILDSEATPSSAAVPNQILFNIPQSDPGRNPATGVFTIIPLSRYPGVNNVVVIDAYTQPGSSPNTNGPGLPDNAHLLIELNGSQAGRPTNGLSIFGDNVTIRGLVINRYVTRLQRGVKQNLLFDGDGILLEASNCVVEGCFIGTDPSGMVARGNEVGGIINFGSNNRIGGLTPAARNVISGNGATGVAGASVQSGNIIEGNFIGTDATGTQALPSNILDVQGLSLASDGVTEEGIRNTVGGITPEARNIVSGNNGAGVRLFRVSGSSAGTSAENDLVEGNYIGTDVTGTKPVPNTFGGVVIVGFNNTIGGTTPAARNIISGNDGNGVDITDTGNMIQGNFIGTDVTGMLPLGNSGGIFAQGPNNTVGGTKAGQGNLISGNNGAGVTIQNNGIVVQGNSIGLDVNGGPLGNGGDGVSIVGSLLNTSENFDGSANTIGPGNTIAFNGGSGVSVTSTAAFSGTGNAVTTNSIFQNGRLGIDLISPTDPPNGVTSNHAGGPVPGPNHFQNFPVLTSAVSAGGQTTAQGTLNSAAKTSYTIEFYASAAPDPTGFGQGRTFAGSTQVTTDAAGSATFTATLPMDLGGQFLTSLAIGPNSDFGIGGSDTSEFSAAIPITGGVPVTPPAVSADLSITGTASPSPASTQNPLTYTFTVTNNGPNTANTVILTNLLPVEVNFQSASSTQGSCTLSGSTVSCNLGNLASGATASVTVVVTPTVAGTLNNTAFVQSATADPTPANNSATVTTTVNPGTVTTDLGVTMTASLTSVKLGSEIIFTITAANAGPKIATGVNFTDTLPAGVTFDAKNSTQGWFQNGNSLTFFYGALAPGDNITLFIAVVPTTAGSITNSVTVGLDQTDPTPANNTATATVTVSPSASVTVLSSSVNPSSAGQPVTLTASVSSPTTGTPTGTVTFTEGTTVLGTGNLNATDQAAVTLSSLSPGAHVITASYGGDANFAASADTLTQTVSGGSTASSVTLSSTPNPSLTGQTVTFTATVTGAGGIPTGAVTFKEGAAMLGAGVLANGKATFTTSTLSAGSHIITALYGGDTTFAGSSSAPITQVVNTPPTPTADLVVTMTASPNPVNVGAPLTYNLTITNNGPSGATAVTVTDTLPAGVTPTSSTSSQGTISVANGVVTIAIGSLASGASATAALVVTAPAAGTLINSASVTANEADPNGANNQVSSSVTAAVPPPPAPGTTTLTLTAAPNPSVVGQSVTLTAVVKPAPPATGTPGGSVTFKEGSTTLGTSPLNNGSANLNIATLPVGSHTITAVYGGDPAFNGSSSAPIVQVVQLASTTTSLSASPNPSGIGQSVVFKAIVASTAAGTPTGTVTFSEGTTILGTGTLVNGSATFSTATLAPGSHIITATYSGDTHFASSASAPLNQVSAAPSTLVTLAVSPDPSYQGQSVTLAASVRPAPPLSGIPTGTVTFMDGARAIGMASLVNGQATIQFDALNVGAHVLQAIYNGSPAFPTGASIGIRQTVNGPPGALFTFPVGISMVSLPYDYTGIITDAPSLFGLQLLSTPTGALFPIATADPVTNSYLYYPNLPGDSGKKPLPGRGYWIREFTPHYFSVFEAGAEVSSPFTTTLQGGWNMIGSPFTAPLDAGTLEFSVGIAIGSHAPNTFLKLPDARQANIIRSSLFTYNAASNHYDESSTLLPFIGYWIYVDPDVTMKQPVTLRFTRPAAK